MGFALLSPSYPPAASAGFEVEAGRDIALDRAAEQRQHTEKLLDRQALGTGDIDDVLVAHRKALRQEVGLRLAQIEAVGDRRYLRRRVADDRLPQRPHQLDRLVAE